MGRNSQLAIGLLDLNLGGCGRHAQCIVVRVVRNHGGKQPASTKQRQQTNRVKRKNTTRRQSYRQQRKTNTIKACRFFCAQTVYIELVCTFCLTFSAFSSCFAAGNKRIICCRRYEIGMYCHKTRLWAFCREENGDFGEWQAVPGVKSVYRERKRPDYLVKPNFTSHTFHSFFLY